jgi:type II secretory pathway component PulM
MGEFLPAVITAGAGLVLLVLVLWLAVPPVRRFRRASAELQVDTRGRMALLQQLVNARRRPYE